MQGNKNWSLRLSLALMVCCACQSKQGMQRSLIAGDNGKYWDKVYISDIDGNPQPTFKTRAGNSRTSVFFGRNGKYHVYYNIDSVRVVNMTTIAGDIILDGEWSFIGEDSLGDIRLYKILKLTEDSLLLQYSEKSIRKYVKSKYQDKIICKTRNCK